MDIAVGLDIQTSESINTKHDGFIYSYTVDSDSNKIDMDEYYIGEYKDLSNSIIKNKDIVKFNGHYYRLTWLNSDDENKYIQRSLITPTNTTYWISLDDYNIKYASEIKQRIDILSQSYGWIVGINTGLVLDTKTNTWRKSGYYSGNEWISNGEPGLWVERYDPWIYACAVTYNNKIYICIKQHSNYLNPPDGVNATTDAEWIKLEEKRELLFQNHDNIEAATDINNMYITTGNSFVDIELI